MGKVSAGSLLSRRAGYLERKDVPFAAKALSCGDPAVVFPLEEIYFLTQIHQLNLHLKKLNSSHGSAARGLKALTVQWLFSRHGCVILPSPLR